MPVQAGSLQSHIYRSLTAYFRQTLVTTEGLAVHFHADQTFNAEGRAQWVAISYGFLDVARAWDVYASSLQKASRINGWIELALLDRVSRRTNIYAPAQLRDNVLRHVLPGTAIPIYDYDSAGPPVVNYVHCRMTTGRLLDTGDETGVTRYDLNVETSYEEYRS